MEVWILNKLRIPLILLSVVILTLLLVGCGNKATGGGWFIGQETNATIDTEGNYVTFGFTMLPDVDDDPEFYPNIPPEGAWLIDAKGQFQLVDHTLGTRIHGTITNAPADLTETGQSLCIGICSITGSGSYDGSYTFMALFTDGEGYDFINLFVDLDEDGLPGKDADLFYDGLLFDESGTGAISIHIN
jgi:hypothetical protein